MMPVLFCLLFVLGRPMLTTHTNAASMQAQSATSAEREAVAAVVRELDAAWNTRDAARFAAVFAQEGSFELPVEGIGLRGRGEIRRRYSEIFPTLTPDLRHVTTTRALDVILPGLVAVDIEVDIVGTDPTTGTTDTPLIHYAGLGLGVRTDGEWHIRLARVYRVTK